MRHYWPIQKKNYTIDLLEDNKETSYKCKFGDWPKQDSIPSTNRTDVYSLEIIGEPTFENNSLIFDGIFAHKLNHRIISRKTFTVEIWFNDIYPNVTSSTIASLYIKHRGYGDSSVTYKSTTKINTSRITIYTDRVISHNRVLKQTEQ